MPSDRIPWSNGHAGLELVMPLRRSRISRAVLELFRKTHLVPPNFRVIISPYCLAHFDKVGPGFTGGIIGPTPTMGYPFGPSGYLPFEEDDFKTTINSIAF